MSTLRIGRCVLLSSLLSVACGGRVGPDNPLDPLDGDSSGDAHAEGKGGSSGRDPAVTGGSTVAQSTGGGDAGLPPGTSDAYPKFDTYPTENFDVKQLMNAATFLRTCGVGADPAAFVCEDTTYVFEEPIAQIALGGHLPSRPLTCVLLQSGKAVCVDGGVELLGPLAKDETFLQLDAGELVPCGLTRDGVILPYRIQSEKDRYVHVSCEDEIVCAITEGGFIDCFATSSGSVTTPFPRPFPETHERVEVLTPDTVCALREGGATCLRLTDSVPLPLPAASYVELAGGYRTACGILPDGSATCWQWEQDGSAFTAFERSTFPDGPLHGLSVGLNSILYSGESVACAHRDDETPVCWVYDP